MIRMSKLTFWKMDASPPCNAVRVLAEILRLELDAIEVNFLKLEHKSPEFLKINPLGTLPVLKDHDFTLTDILLNRTILFSHAQMIYLLSKYGSSDLKEKLYPSDIYSRALVDQSLYLDAAVLFIRIKLAALPALFEGLKASTDRHIKDIEYGYSVREAYIGTKKYIAAEHMTIADICIGATVAGTVPIHKLDKNRYPRTIEWLDRMFKIPEFNKYISVGTQLWSQYLDDAWAKNNAVS